MRRWTPLVAAVGCGLVAGSAVGAVGWRPFASSTDKSEFVTFATASASVQNPNGLALRATGTSKGKPFEIDWHINCDGKSATRSGQVVVASVPASSKCSVYASASGGPGSVRLELLRR